MQFFVFFSDLHGIIHLRVYSYKQFKKSNIQTPDAKK